MIPYIIVQSSYHASMYSTVYINENRQAAIVSVLLQYITVKQLKLVGYTEVLAKEAYFLFEWPW